MMKNEIINSRVDEAKISQRAANLQARFIVHVISRAKGAAPIIRFEQTIAFYSTRKILILQISCRGTCQQ